MLPLRPQAARQGLVPCRIGKSLAAGHDAVKTDDGDVPIEIMESLIAKTKQQVRIR